MADSRYKDKTRDGDKTRELECPDGYKGVDGKCVKMTAKEMRNRSRSAHRSKRVQGNKQKYIDKKRIDTIEKNENTTMEDKVRQMVREEIRSVLQEGNLKKEIGKMETENKQFTSYLEALLPELGDPNEKLFNSAVKNFDLGFKQLKNVFKHYE